MCVYEWVGVFVRPMNVILSTLSNARYYIGRSYRPIRSVSDRETETTFASLYERKVDASSDSTVLAHASRNGYR